jgi:hypothetical protein
MSNLTFNRKQILKFLGAITEAVRARTAARRGFVIVARRHARAAARPDAGASPSSLAHL